MSLVFVDVRSLQSTKFSGYGLKTLILEDTSTGMSTSLIAIGPSHFFTAYSKMSASSNRKLGELYETSLTFLWMISTSAVKPGELPFRHTTIVSRPLSTDKRLS